MLWKIKNFKKKKEKENDLDVEISSSMIDYSINQNHHLICLQMDALISHSSKSYYACVGESTHAYQSPSKDLTAINNRLNRYAYIYIHHTLEIGRKKEPCFCSITNLVLFCAFSPFTVHESLEAR